jgi:hypothetical protein
MRMHIVASIEINEQNRSSIHGSQINEANLKYNLKQQLVGLLLYLFSLLRHTIIW